MMPQLWLYADNDHLYDEALIGQYIKRSRPAETAHASNY